MATQPALLMAQLESMSNGDKDAKVRDLAKRAVARLVDGN